MVVEKELYEKYLNKIGNLTLLFIKLNNKIKNNSFKIKKESYKESDIKLNKELVEFEEWTIKSIEERQKMLKIAIQR